MAESKNFNHLKIHSQYSICEGAIKIDDLKEYCKKNKIQSVGLSDTYNLSGALEFSENISSVGTQPIIGTQVQFRFKNTYGFIPLIAKNYVGYKNIIELSSKSYLENTDNDQPHCSIDDLHTTIIHHNFTISHICKISIVSCINYDPIFIF